MSDFDSVQAMWAAFTSARSDLADEATSYTAWHFCDNEADANELADLVLAGVKRATAGLASSYEAEGEALPRVGDFSVVTDWGGAARCVIRTNAVEIVAFRDVTPEFAATEGEGDGSLEYWRRAHRQAFSRELAARGDSLADGMQVVCERFDVVYPETSGTPARSPGAD